MINLRFSYTEDDYIPAWRMHLMRKPKTIVFFSFLYFLLIVLLKMLLGMEFDAPSFMLIAIVSLLSLIALLFYFVPHQSFQHSYKAVDEHWFHITEQGIFYETGGESGVLPWRRCTKMLEGKQFYLFEHDHRRITVIPKRTFKDTKEENAFRAILKSKLIPALSSKLLREKESKPEEEYVPPEKTPDWR